VYFARLLLTPIDESFYVHITHKERGMTNDFAADVLICGAGAAGLTLAIDLPGVACLSG
jgi:ribulose 1,5-bisphosphate synthetase/thiazole synthase